MKRPALYSPILGAPSPGLRQLSHFLVFVATCLWRCRQGLCTKHPLSAKAPSILCSCRSRWPLPEYKASSPLCDKVPLARNSAIIAKIRPRGRTNFGMRGVAASCDAECQNRKIDDSSSLNAFAASSWRRMASKSSPESRRQKSRSRDMAATSASGSPIRDMRLNAPM